MPEVAANLKIRADLMLSLRQYIQNRELTLEQVAQFFDQASDRIGNLLKGEIDEFTIEQLITRINMGIQIAIEGPGATTAAAELFNLAAIEGSYEVAEGVTREGTLAVMGTIVGITVGAMTIGETLHKWYQGYRAKASPERIERVLIVTPTSRLLLEDATIEEITNALKPLAK